MDEEQANNTELTELGSGEFMDRWVRALKDVDTELQQGPWFPDTLRSTSRIDVFFLAFLRTMARFGIFTVGPITIHVATVEKAVRQAVREDDGRQTDDMAALLNLAYEERTRAGRRTVDEVHMLLAFMKIGKGVPARVFGELGVSPQQVEEFIRAGPRQEEEAAGVMESLYSPEEAAAYLKVHVQTVREWIRSGRLRASRLAGQRALRIRASDLNTVLEPLDIDSNS
jgi:excisionase family DNA binding protein